ncbi:XRE family transcriptional regulator [Bifidobacterium adolescentis]|uniref:XRE family transcriptional regulator n=1 Tax=Bifidobacterium adolescentis TaxID=1680 RepID=UPI003D024B0F
MAYKAKNEVTEDSRKIINVCRNLLSDSGMSIKEFLYSSGLGNNYWYMRMRYEAPLNTSDVEHIASTFGLTSLDIYTRALGSEAARAYARERESRITDDLIDRIAAHPEDYDVAALTNPDKEAEMNGGEGR